MDVQFGSVEAIAAASYTDADGAYMDYDGATYAQFGAKKTGGGSLGVRIRTILAGAVKNAITIASSGLLITLLAGSTLAAQAITATTGTFSGGIAITGNSTLTSGSLHISSGGLTVDAPGTTTLDALVITNIGESIHFRAASVANDIGIYTTAIDGTLRIGRWSPEAPVVDMDALTSTSMFYGTVQASTDGTTQDLGAVSHRFRDLRLKRTAYIGTSVEVGTGVTGYALNVGSTLLDSLGFGSTSATYGVLSYSGGYALLRATAGNELRLGAHGVDGDLIIATTGAVTTVSTINGQTLSAAASLTGTLAVAGNVTVGGTSGVVVTSASASNAGLKLSITGDTFERLFVSLGGVLGAGGGGATQDVIAGRLAAGSWRVTASTGLAANLDATTVFTVGGGGGAPTATRTARTIIQAPSSGTFLGNAHTQLLRAATIIWEYGIDSNGAGDAKLASSDFYFWNQATAKYVMAISAAGRVKTLDKLLATAGIGVGNSAAATTLGTVQKKMQVFDDAGASLGYVAIYDAIT